jgi:hypothetical protein
MFTLIFLQIVDYDYSTPAPNIRRQDGGPRRGRDEYNDDFDDSDDSSEVVSAALLFFICCIIVCYSPCRVFQKYLGTTRTMVPTYDRRSTKRQVSFVHVPCFYNANSQLVYSPFFVLLFFFFQKYDTETAFVSPRRGGGRDDGGKWGAAPAMKCMPYPVTSSFVLGGGVSMKTPPSSRIPTTVLFEHHRRRVDAVDDDVVDDDDDMKQKAKRRSVVDDDVDDALLEASFTAFLKRRKVNEALFVDKEGFDNDVAAIVFDSSSPVKEVEPAAGTGGTQGTTTTGLGALPETQAMLQKLAAMCPSPGASSSASSRKMTALYAEAHRLAGWKVDDSTDSRNE